MRSWGLLRDPRQFEFHDSINPDFVEFGSDEAVWNVFIQAVPTSSIPLAPSSGIGCSYCRDT
jgi:hypothetical protein